MSSSRHHRDVARRGRQELDAAIGDDAIVDQPHAEAFLDRAAHTYPNRLAVVHGDQRYTWREVFARCRRLASALMTVSKPSA